MSKAATPARRAAFEVVRRVFEHDAWADRAFPAAAERHGLEGRERAQAQALAFGAVKRRGTSDHVAAELARRPVAGLDAPVRAALRLGLFEVLFSEAADHAAVDGAVALAKSGMSKGGARRAAGAAGLVNAVLRRATRERDELLGALDDSNPTGAAVAHSVPEWLARMWWDELGAADARSLLRAMNEPAETALRHNPLREPGTSPNAHNSPARRADRDDPLWPPEAVVLDGPLGPTELTALAEGRMFAQSRAAQAVIEVLGPRPGERVLDLCAGPGGKTLAIAGRMAGEGEVVAVEADPGRARQVEELCERGGARNVRVICADASLDVPGRGYDRVLVDPPCSDLGTLGSRPDARWRKDPETIEGLVPIQSAILARGAAALRDGGTLVYSTCTISRRENQGVVADSPLDIIRTIETRPDRDATDGFFIAEMRGTANV